MWVLWFLMHSCRFVIVALLNDRVQRLVIFERHKPIEVLLNNKLDFRGFIVINAPRFTPCIMPTYRSLLIGKGI
jgi:hypothetical protein